MSVYASHTFILLIIIPVLVLATDFWTFTER